MKGLRDDHDNLDKRHNALVERLPDVYARRDDVQSDLDDMKVMLRRIEDRLGTTPNPH